MENLKIGSKVVIRNIKDINCKMSYNENMVKLIGEKAVITGYIKNAYDGNYYYKINIDLGTNTWHKDWLNPLNSKKLKSEV